MDYYINYFNIYKKYNGYIIIDNNKSYISLLINKDDFPINKNNKLYINKNNYEYEIIDIKNDNVLLKVDLDDDIKINNNIVKVNILNKTTTLIKEIRISIKKGLDI